MKTLILSLQFICTVFLSVANPNPQVSWSPENVIKLKFIKDVQLSKDQTSILYVVSGISNRNNKMGYASAIYKTTFSPTKITKEIGPVNCSNFNPRWSPDGKLIAFLSDRTGSSRLNIMDANGEKIEEVWLSPFGIQTFKWSPDSTKIAFVMAEEMKVNLDNLYTSVTYKKPEYINRLWVVDLYKENRQPVAYTSDQYCVRGTGDSMITNEEFDWSPDGKKIVFAHSPSREADDFHLDSSLALLDLETSLISPFCKLAQHESLPKFSPNGQWIAYLASCPAGYAYDRHVMVKSTKDDIVRELAPTFNEGPLFFGPSLLGWSSDSSKVLFFEPKKTKYHLIWLPINGEAVQEVPSGEWFIKEPSLSMDGESLGFIVQSPDTPPEVYTTDLKTFAPKQISEVNESFCAPALLTELIQWKSSDGIDIEGFLTYPLNYQKGKTYPLILSIHGGPMSFYDESFIGTPCMYAWANFAEEGFMVLRPNPRGSTAYGKKFRRLIYGDWGGMDAQDLLCGVDELIKKGLIDPKRMGVMGWSYGGYMSARLITLTNRFKAAVVGAGICNLVSFAGTSDLYRLTSDYLGESWSNPILYHDRSPLFSIEKIETPCLILHGDADIRVPVSQAFEFYQALKTLQKPVRLKIYPGMGHGCYDPSMLIDLMHENVNWFKIHL